ncbi:MAG: AAA family ATPase [Pseudomonadota bacterium]
MVKLHITGNAGSGKTTLARKLGEALALPVHGLDQIVWAPGWEKVPKDVVAERVGALVAEPAWVIEGVSYQVVEAADIVVFLDVPRRISFVRCAKRNWRYLFRSRPGLPENCPELLIVPKLVEIIWKFKANVRPPLLSKTEAFGERGFVVRSDSDLAPLYQHLKLAA